MNVATIGLTVGMVGKIDPSAIGQSLDAAHPQLRVDDRHVVVRGAHLAGAAAGGRRCGARPARSVDSSSSLVIFGPGATSRLIQLLNGSVAATSRAILSPSTIVCSS